MANSIKCTCGHSWSKASSSKKDMYVCHICGKDNTMKDGGWLDNYGKKPNPNDVQVSTGPGYVGLGYDVQGRDYSPAWGGQFQNGGILGKTFLQPNDPKLPKGWNPEAKGYSTEYSTTIGKDGEYYLVPGFKRGKLVSDPEKEFHKTGELLGGPFKTIQSAQDFADRRHKYVEQGKPIPSPIKTYDYLKFAMGGSLPGAVGFTYARVAGSAPSNGKYAKKTKASAQNGKDVQKERYNELYAPIENKIFDAIGTQDSYDRLPSSTKDFLNKTIAGFSVASNRNIPPMDPIIKEVQEKVKKLPKEEISKLLKTDWSEIGLAGAMKNTPSSVSYLDMLKYVNHFNKLKKKGYTLQNGGEMKFYQEGLDFKPKTISQNGSVIKDDRGQWAYPGEITEINSNDITMQGVDYPVLGISDTGDTQMMYPDQDYKFDGEKVTEYPIMQNGGGLSRFDLETMTALEKDIKNQKAKNTQETISQYTPKPGDQQRMNAAKDAYRAEQAKPLNRAASSKVATKAMENIVEPMLAIDMAMGVGKLAKPALKAAGKYLTEETALKNTYKLNPYTYKPVPGSKNLAINSILENPIDEYRNLDVFLAAKDTQKQVENEMIRRSGIENKALGEIEGLNLGVRRSSPTSKYKFSNETYNPFSEYGYGAYDEQALKQSYSDSFDDYIHWKQNMLKKLPKNKNGGWLDKYK